MRLRVSASLVLKQHEPSTAGAFLVGGALLHELQQACDGVLTKYGYRPQRYDEAGRVPDTLSIELEH